MIVDAHVHLFPDRLAEAIRRWFSEHAWEIRYRLGVDEAVRTLREGGIDRFVVLPYAHKTGMAAALNDFTLQLARAYPEVVPCCTAFPGEEGIERLLDGALGEQGFHGVKIHSHVMRVAPDDPRLDPVWRASARHRKPVVIHCGREPASAGYGTDVRALSGAARLRRALARHPDAICIVPHLGMDEPAAFEALLDEFPNLYLDTTMAITGYFPDPPDLDILRRRADRILYGTDFPNLPYGWDRELQVVRGLGLPPSDEARILSGNAIRLFGLQSSDIQ
ncbi:MAG: amidohydrolase [Deltaproteobacteria bacterium]|nr:MAG: amidohydrolase [Deltaproteobacteria bacterium]